MQKDRRRQRAPQREESYFQASNERRWLSVRSFISFFANALFVTDAVSDESERRGHNRGLVMPSASN